MVMPSPDLLDPLALSLALMREPSVTPEAASCFDLLETWLHSLGFEVERVTLEGDDGAPTQNFYARLGSASPNICFAGHVDVVPPGDLAAWRVPPFEPVIEEGILYGRGAEDMKAAIAAMVSACARLMKGEDKGTLNAGSISFLLTADEEGNGINGTGKYLKQLAARGEVIDYCLVGEPTNVSFLGEMAKIGRRGSLTCRLDVAGKQGHVAYPHLAENPITRLVAMLYRLKSTVLDEGTEFFPPTNLEITSVDVGNHSDNSIPAAASAAFNIRFNDLHSGASLQGWVREQCDAVGGNYELQMRISGESFLSPPGRLSEALVASVEEVTGHSPQLSTTGGTSDARFIKDYAHVIEFGTTGLTPHQVNECVETKVVEQLTQVYEHFLTHMLVKQA